MKRLRLRLTCLFLMLILAIAAIAIPDSQMALAMSEEKIPSIVNIKTADSDVKHITYCRTLIAAIDEAGVNVGENDRLNLPDDTALLPGQQYDVTVTRLDEVNLTYGGFSLTATAEFISLADLMTRSGFDALDLSDGSRIENRLTAGGNLNSVSLNYVNVDQRSSQKLEAIPFTTIIVDDDTMYVGKSVVKTAGQNGTRALYYLDTYENNILISSLLTQSEVVLDPVQQVVRQGTKTHYALINYKTLTSSVANSLNKISPYLNPPGALGDVSYHDNGNGTITVGGNTFEYTAVKRRKLTSYDGLDVCMDRGCHTPAINHKTFSGIPAQRGIVAVSGTKIDGKYIGSNLPFGTVVYIEHYGFGVVGDINGGKNNSDFIDCGFNPGDCRNGYTYAGGYYGDVYIIKLP